MSAFAACIIYHKIPQRQKFKNTTPHRWPDLAGHVQVRSHPPSRSIPVRESQAQWTEARTWCSPLFCSTLQRLAITIIGSSLDEDFQLQVLQIYMMSSKHPDFLEALRDRKDAQTLGIKQPNTHNCSNILAPQFKAFQEDKSKIEPAILVIHFPSLMNS